MINKLKNITHNAGSRSKKTIRNSFYIFIIRGISIAISFLYVPILINQLDTTNYGIWLTLTSIISWCSFLDIGLGHGLRNLLAEAIAKDEKQKIRSLVGTAYATLSIIIVCIIPLIAVIFPLFNWSKILNAPTDMSYELMLLSVITIICFFIQFVLRLINSILFALQKPAYSSFIALIAQLFAFIIVYILSLQNQKYSLLIYGSIISVVPVVITFLFSIYLFQTKLSFLSFKSKDINFLLTKQLFKLGFKFFFIQFTAIMLFQSNNLILAHIAEPSKVADFNIAYKYIGIISMLFSIIITPIWSATTDAFHKQDFQWITKTIKTLKKIFLLFSIIGVVLVLISDFIYKIWLGETIKADYGVLLLILGYYISSMWCGIYCNILNGIGKVKLQFYITFIEALIHIPLAIFLGKIYGIYGVLISMFLMTFLNTIWEPIQVDKLLKNKAKGIWNS